MGFKGVYITHTCFHDDIIAIYITHTCFCDDIIANFAAQQTGSSTRICQKGGIPLDVEGQGPTQRALRAEREVMDVQDLSKDFKRHPKVS